MRYLNSQPEWKVSGLVLYLLFQKGKAREHSKHQDVEDEDAVNQKRIRCPKCKWQPSASSRWYCSDCLEPEFYLEGCGMAWNTFDTGGKCPGCRHVWRWTSCLACSRWSLHFDWYENGGR
ncbi:MAG: hypothetical protein HKN25_11360 [Pyrinomonadaceae bacterium]|nr:hypothetical protein [Pyrinomonadaceae bacterium]